MARIEIRAIFLSTQHWCGFVIRDSVLLSSTLAAALISCFY